LRFSRKGRMFKVNKLFIINMAFCPWALQLNDALKLANQSMHHIDYKFATCLLVYCTISLLY